MQKTIVISLGGSLIVPHGIDIDFLKKFKAIIEKFIKENYKFVIYCGGGRLARDVQQAASKVTRLTSNDLDWLGIQATKLNAELIKKILKNNAEDFIVDNPNDKIIFKKNVLIAAGWVPGWSTDNDAVLLAKNLGIREIINMSNVAFIYDKDPRNTKDAKKIKKISWNDFTKLTSNKWKSGMNTPFDPVASRQAQKLGMRVCVIGKDLKNLENLLKGRKFRGTIIQ